MNLAFVLMVAFMAANSAKAIWPIPQHLSTGNDIAFIDESIKVTYNGQAMHWHREYGSDSQQIISDYHGRLDQHTVNTINEPSYSPLIATAIILPAVERALRTILQQNVVPWMLNPAGSEFEPALGFDGVGYDHAYVKSLDIRQTKNDDSNLPESVAGPPDESYQLNLTLNGAAYIEAASSIGVLRALETFTQLFFKHSSTSASYTKLAPVFIQDFPRFSHRGMLLDLSRHWFTVGDIQRTIDGLAMSKMNIMHLHITDTQSWPIEIPALPNLAKRGCYAPGLTYSPADIKSIQEYGHARGVQVLLEVDMPGHVGIERAYPGLTVGYNEKPFTKYCAQPPCGAFKLNNTNVEDFVSTLFDDLLPRLNPYATYFHTGGDEYKATNSLLDPDLRTDEMAVLKPLLQRFLDHVHGKVREHGLVPIVWEEMVGDWAAEVGNNTVIQSWLGKESVQKLAQAGHKVIDSSAQFYYLDCGRGNWVDYTDGSSQQGAYPFNDWCSPTKNWRLIYTHDPIEHMTATAAKNVIGGEVAVWTETIDPTNLDTVVWPCAAAAGEAWWSGRADIQGNTRSMHSARPRLEEMRERMLARGVRGAPISQLFCEQSPLGDCTA